MVSVPITTHIINFLIKFFSFSMIFFLLHILKLITFPFFLLISLPLFFTLIGIIADWVIVPKHHNIHSSLMGALFMGTVTYFIPFFFGIGNVSIKGAFFIALLLGIVEATLHRLIVKPYLKKA